MSFSEDDIRAAAQAVALRDEQVTGLMAVLHARRAASDAAPVVPPAPARVRFDLAHLLWYAGALVILGALTLFTTLAFDMMGGMALVVTAVLYAAALVLGGHHLWHRRSLCTPGGLLIALAVAMAPMAVFGFQDVLGWWDAGDAPGRYHGFYLWVKSGWLPMEIATVLAGLVALRFYPFPFITAVIAFALWFMSMDLTPWFFPGDDLTWAARKKVSMAFGLVVLAGAWAIDLKRSPDRDFAFWLHLSGLLAFWGGLTFSESSSELGKVLYCLINVALVLLSVFLMRRAYALFGAIGVAVYLGYLAGVVFEDSLLFPFALSLIGLLIIGLGLLLHRRHQTLSVWISTHLPDPLKKLRPPHASSIRLEHA